MPAPVPGARPPEDLEPVLTPGRRPIERSESDVLHVPTADTPPAPPGPAPGVLSPVGRPALSIRPQEVWLVTPEPLGARIVRPDGERRVCAGRTLSSALLPGFELPVGELLE